MATEHAARPPEERTGDARVAAALDGSDADEAVVDWAVDEVARAGGSLHLVHVLIGLGMLLFVATRLGRKPFEDEETAVAGTALFWHMCDIAWLFLFPLFYVR